MSNDNQGDLDALIQGKIDADNDFQASLDSLSDDEKEQTISQKRAELIKQEYSSVADKAKKNEELANNYKIRAEKAEKGTPIKPNENPPPKKEDGDLSPKDLYALMESKVPQADIDEVIKASKLLGKSVAETLQDGFVKARLKDLNEQRDTANATNTTGSKRTTVKLDDAGLVEKALQGKDVDPEALAMARINLKKSQKK